MGGGVLSHNQGKQSKLLSGSGNRFYCDEHLPGLFFVLSNDDCAADGYEKWNLGMADGVDIPYGQAR